MLKEEKTKEPDCDCSSCEEASRKHGRGYTCRLKDDVFRISETRGRKVANEGKSRGPPGDDLPAEPAETIVRTYGRKKPSLSFRAIS